MASANQVKDFLAQRTVVLVGLSRSGQAFSHRVCQELKVRGYRVYPVNPNADTIQSEPCYHAVADLPEPAGSALFLTPPAETGKAVREAVAAGVQHRWLRQGAETPEAVCAAQERSVNLVSGECIFMSLSPVRFPHALHRWAWGALGKLPRQERLRNRSRDELPLRRQPATRPCSTLRSLARPSSVRPSGQFTDSS